MRVTELGKERGNGERERKRENYKRSNVLPKKNSNIKT